ncbi:MAG TPA: methyltransferase domain-containing protein [Acidimicrobiales bacterium]|nr:methyltransferase domain-containing protein [Acidimicrobiales bacterium]
MTEATGERFVPEAMGGELIEAEHVARYALAGQLAHGRRVLDAGCGVGWGTQWLLRSGAASAKGLDISAEAIADSKRRVPEAEFVQGDLARIPWEDATFDLVVCFEALEHVAAQKETMDELVRVLAPEGILLVSSPNPRVYPPGNPFHIHELTPEELIEEVGQRLPHCELWYQHPQIASVLVNDRSLPYGATDRAEACVVSPLESGTDMYSLVVASRSPLPALTSVLACSPSNLHALLSEREPLLSMIETLEAEREGLRRQREQTSLLLLQCEQRLARQESAAATELDETVDQLVQEQLSQTIADLNRLVIDLSDEIADLRGSTSWRVTAPLRTFSTALRRRRA